MIEGDGIRFERTEELPPILKLFFLVEPMFSIFQKAIKFDCLFLAIFQSFHLFVSFIFDILAPHPK